MEQGISFLASTELLLCCLRLDSATDRIRLPLPFPHLLARLSLKSECRPDVKRSMLMS